MEIEVQPSSYSNHFKDFLFDRSRYQILFGGRGCFGKKTKVETKNGYKKISKIKIGDVVKSFNFNKNISEFKEVVNVFKYENKDKCIKINYDGRIIICTLDHKFYYKGEFIEIAKILKENEISIN